MVYVSRETSARSVALQDRELSASSVVSIWGIGARQSSTAGRVDANR